MVSKKPRVLIVDDEQVICDVLCDELSERGYLCITALDGNEALIKLVTNDFDVVLLDIKLPGMSGLEVLRELWSNQSKAVTIMITAISDVDTAVEAMKLGASYYIAKPFDLNELDTDIRTALKTEQTTSKSFTEMDAITCGVEARLDSALGYSKVVIQETIDVARRLDIPEKRIQSWAATRASRYAERMAAIGSSLDKLERNPLAQKLLGMTIPHRYTLKSDEPQS